MALGIHKPGQGYWTRVLTAVGAGALGLSTAGWLWRELARVQTSFETVYLQGSAALLVTLLTAAMVYWFVGANPRSVDFLIATDGEMRKVHWPSRREVQGSTWVVIGVSLLIAAILFVADVVFAQFFTLIRVLEAS